MSIGLIILDRDGVINFPANYPNRYITRREDLLFYSDVLYFLTFMREINIPVVVATNQQGVALGHLTIHQLNDLHNYISNTFNFAGVPLIDRFYSCIHSVGEQCLCRKPEPGLLNQALEDYSITPSRALFIGDSISDYQAALNAKTKFRLIVRDHLDSHDFFHLNRDMLLSSLNDLNFEKDFLK